MTKKINKLPYFNISINKSEKELANLLLKKLKTKIKKRLPQHYLVQAMPSKSLDYIKQTAMKYPYFLRFDIKLYFPSINHEILKENINRTYFKLNNKNPSKTLNHHLNNTLINYLNKCPYKKGIPTDSKLSYVLGAIYLLDLDLEITNPFLRKYDDYLIFCRNKKEPEELLKEVIIPKLKSLDLEINEKKLISGKFHQDKLDFIGFNYYASYFTIKEEKIENFKQKIKQITYLTHKKSERAIIKQLNNKILGFAHYYKFSACSLDFKLLDSFVRSRLRRYIFKQKNLCSKKANLHLTNQNLKKLKLKSLEEIKKRFRLKKSMKKSKKQKIETKTNKKSSNYYNNIKQVSTFHQQKQILEQLNKISKTIKKLNQKINRIEKSIIKGSQRKGDE